MTKRLSILQCVLIEGAFLAIAALIVFAISDYTTMTGKLADLAPYWGGIIALLTPVLSMLCINETRRSFKQIAATGLLTLFVSVIASMFVMVYLYGQSTTLDWLRIFTLVPMFTVVGVITVVIICFLLRKKMNINVSPSQPV